MRKIWWTIAGSGLAAALAVSTALAQSGVETVPAEYRSVAREHVLDGVIEAVNQSTVSAQVTARVTAIHFDVDDQVEVGALLIEFDDTEYRARLREARATRQAANARLQAAQAHFDRIENLRARNTASQADLDSARAELDASRGALDAADAVIARIEQQLEYTRVRAPYSGIVTARHIEVGETANVGTPLMSGFSLEKLRAVVHLPQRLSPSSDRLSAARVMVPGREEAIASTAVTVFPYAAEQTGTVAVRIALPANIHGVYPGMLIKVAFTVGERLRLSVPARSLVHRSEVTGVYVVDEEGVPALRYVRAGEVDADDTVEILSGLDEGERVALDPAHAMALARGSNR